MASAMPRKYALGTPRSVPQSDAKPMTNLPTQFEIDITETNVSSSPSCRPCRENEYGESKLCSKL
jgi:hypothetical protein